MERVHTYSSDDILLVISNQEPLPCTVVKALKQSIQQSTDNPSAPRVEAIEDPTDSTAYIDKVCVFLGESMQPMLHNIYRTKLEACNQRH